MTKYIGNNIMGYEGFKVICLPDKGFVRGIIKNIESLR